MSIINDALKKAEKEKIKIHPKRYLLNKRLVSRIAIVVFCSLGVVLLWQYFNIGFKTELLWKTASNTAVSNPQASPRAFHLRKFNLETPASSVNFQLSGIVYDEQGPLAIINGRVVGEGALINGAQLVEIRPNYVKLSQNEKVFTIGLSSTNP